MGSLYAYEYMSTEHILILINYLYTLSHDLDWNCSNAAGSGIDFGPGYISNGAPPKDVSTNSYRILNAEEGPYSLVVPSGFGRYSIVRSAPFER